MDRRKRRRLLSALQSGILEDIRSISNTAIASFTGDGRDLVRLVVGIEPIQAGSGDPSPDNVRPISGWTECKVTRTGKNLVNITAVDSSVAGISWTMNSDGTVTADGTASAFAGKFIADVNLKAGVTYHLSGGVSGKVNFYLYKSGLGTLRTDTGSGANYTPANDISGANVYFSVGGGVTVDNLTLYPQIEVGNSGSEWEAYQGQTYTIDLDGTRYGGTLDVTTGKLTVTHGVKTFDGTEGWTKESSGNYYKLNWQSGAYVPASSIGYGIANYLKWAESTSTNVENTIRFGNTNPNVTYIILPSFANDLATLTSYLQAHPLTIVYKLATPIEVQLTPTQITTLSGANNIWADTGDIILLEYMA